MRACVLPTLLRRHSAADYGLDDEDEDEDEGSDDEGDEGGQQQQTMGKLAKKVGAYTARLS